MFEPLLLSYKHFFKHFSGSISTRMTSPPTFSISQRSITNSLSLPINPNTLHGPGTIMQFIVPHVRSKSKSHTYPSLCPSTTFITSFCFSSQSLRTFHPARSFLLYYMKEWINSSFIFLINNFSYFSVLTFPNDSPAPD